MIDTSYACMHAYMHMQQNYFVKVKTKIIKIIVIVFFCKSNCLIVISLLILKNN